MLLLYTYLSKFMCFIHAYIVHTNLHHTKDILCFHFISYPNHLYEYRVGSFPNSSVPSSPMALCWPLLASVTPRFSRWEGSRRRVSFRCPWRAQVEKGWPQPPKWCGSVENQWNHRNLIEIQILFQPQSTCSNGQANKWSPHRNKN